MYQEIIELEAFVAKHPGFSFVRIYFGTSEMELAFYTRESTNKVGISQSLINELKKCYRLVLFENNQLEYEEVVVSLDGKVLAAWFKSIYRISMLDEIIQDMI